MFNLKNQVDVYNTLCRKKSFAGEIILSEKEFDCVFDAFLEKEVIAVHDFYEASPLYVKVVFADFKGQYKVKDGVRYPVLHTELKLC